MILLTDDVQNSEEFGPFWWVLMIFYLILVIAPWVFIIFRYGIFRKLRIHLIMPNGKELPSLYLKKNQQIILPDAPIIDGYVFDNWYIDPEFENEYIDMPMPNKNIKLYAKYNKITEIKE